MFFQPRLFLRRHEALQEFVKGRDTFSVDLHDLISDQPERQDGQGRDETWTGCLCWFGSFKNSWITKSMGAAQKKKTHRAEHLNLVIHLDTKIPSCTWTAQRQSCQRLKWIWHRESQDVLDGNGWSTTSGIGEQFSDRFECVKKGYKYIINLCEISRNKQTLRFEHGLNWGCGHPWSATSSLQKPTTEVPCSKRPKVPSCWKLHKQHTRSYKVIHGHTRPRKSKFQKVSR